MNLTHNNQSQIIASNQLLKMDFILFSRTPKSHKVHVHGKKEDLLQCWKGIISLKSIFKTWFLSKILTLQLTAFQKTQILEKIIHFHSFGFLARFNCNPKLCPTNTIARHAGLIMWFLHEFQTQFFPIFLFRFDVFRGSFWGFIAVHLIYIRIASLEPFLHMCTLINNKYYNNTIVHAKLTNC